MNGQTTTTSPKYAAPNSEFSNLSREAQNQLRIVIQILKDRTTRYDKPRLSEHQRKPNTLPPDEISSGYGHITSEGLRNDQYTYSARVVEAKLDEMRHRNPNSWWAIEDYFSLDSGHGDFEWLAQRARTSDTARATYARLQIALCILTSRLMDKHLHARFPAKVDTRTNRRRAMEEHYAEIERVYESWCEDLKLTERRYLSQAYDNTAISMNVARSTVERAVKFIREQREREGLAA